SRYWLLRDHRRLPSFPTRRSSDLSVSQGWATVANQRHHRHQLRACLPGDHLWIGPDRLEESFQPFIVRHIGIPRVPYPAHGLVRSEEHTSELQSREKLVCRLLLEK